MKKPFLMMALLLLGASSAEAKKKILVSVTKTNPDPVTGKYYHVKSDVVISGKDRAHTLECMSPGTLPCEWATGTAPGAVVSPTSGLFHPFGTFEQLVQSAIGAGNSSGQGNHDGIPYSWTGTSVTSYTITIEE